MRCGQPTLLLAAPPPQVPQLYKRLKYPFQISKSNLSAVGSPHTWPSLLAALTWLVELLNYQERAEAARQVSVAHDTPHCHNKAGQFGFEWCLGSWEGSAQLAKRRPPVLFSEIAWYAMQSPPAYTLWPHYPALPARVALQDVGDERSRTESEFFQYVSQVSAGATQAGRAKCRALPSRPCLVSGIFFWGAFGSRHELWAGHVPNAKHAAIWHGDQAGKREALAFGTPTIGHAKRPAPHPQVYRYFMTGDDAKCEEEDGKQAAEFEARAGGVKADTERLRAVGVPWACVPGQIAKIGNALHARGKRQRDVQSSFIFGGPHHVERGPACLGRV